MDIERAQALVQDKDSLGTGAGILGGSVLLGNLLKSWGASEAKAAMKQGKKLRHVHPGLAAGAGALLALLGKHAYDKYKESQYGIY